MIGRSCTGQSNQLIKHPQLPNAMNITTMSFFHLRTPLRLQFAQANQNTRRADSVIVRLQTKEGSIGYGEACPRTYVTGESATGVMEALQQIKAELCQQSFATLADIETWTGQQLLAGAGPALVCALELALLDAWSWEYQQDLAEAFSLRRAPQEVSYSGVLPFGNWQKLRPLLAQFSFGSWKFKARAEVAANEQRIKDMQELFGNDLPLRMDANGGWNLEQARRQIEAGLALGVNSFEQPLEAQATKDSQKLVEEYGADARIMADEALCTLADAKSLIDFQACNHFSLKLSKNGGLFNTLRIYQLAQKKGIACQLSAHYGETSILSSAGLLFASIAHQLTACEGALGTFLLSEDITKTPVMINRQGRITGMELSFIGWPVPVNEDSLQRNSVLTELGL